MLKTSGIATTLDKRLADYGVVINHNTMEYMALLSLQFNTKVGDANLIGNDLRQALKDGNRAEAWFEIRYNSNKNALAATPPDNAKGIAKRRFYESEIFSLYDAGDSAQTKDEAMQVYQMFTKNRDKILDYEGKYGYLNGQNGSVKNMISEANSAGGYGLAGTSNEVHTLQTELLLSATRLMDHYIKDEYGVGRFFDSLNIQVASDTNLILTGEGANARTGTNQDLLIGIDTQSNFLHGKAGNDMLIGGSQADYLDGGGVDTYVINGDDQIIDEGENNIIWKGKLIAGIFKKDTATGAYKFLCDDEEYILAFHSPGQLTLSAEDSITFVNQTSAAGFANNDFGINLIENQPDDFERTLTGPAGGYYTGYTTRKFTLHNDAPNGGDDALIGGKGDVTYEVNSAGDIVIEEAAEGIDTIRTSVNFALPENVEYIFFTGATFRKPWFDPDFL